MWYLRHHARRVIRNTMRPMDPEKAKIWLTRVRILYFVLGMTAFGFAYANYHKNKEVLDPLRKLDPTDAHRLMRLKGEPGKVKIMRIGIGEGVQYYEYDNEEYIKEYDQKAESLKAELRKKAAEKAQKASSNE